MARDASVKTGIVIGMNTKGLRTGLAEFGSIMTGLRSGLQMVRGSMRTLTNAFGSVIKASAEFNSAVSEIGTITGKGFALDDVRSEVLRMSQAFGQMPTDTAKAFYQAVSSGANTTAEAVALLTATNKLAIGGLAGVEETSAAVLNVINAYGVSFTEAEAISDRMFKTVQKGVTTIGGLANSIGFIAPAAGQMKVSMDTLFSSIAAGSKVMGSAGRFIIGLNQAFVNMNKPSKMAREEAKRLGIEFNGAMLKGEGLLEFIKNLSTAQKRNSSTVAKLFKSSQAQAAINSLLTTGYEELVKLQEAMAESGGAANEAFVAMTKTFGFQQKQLKATGQVLKIVLGDMITKSQAAGGFVRGLSEAFTLMAAQVERAGVEFGTTGEEASQFARDLVSLAAKGFGMLLRAGSAVIDIFTSMRVAILFLRAVHAKAMGFMANRLIDFLTPLRLVLKSLERVGAIDLGGIDLQIARVRGGFDGLAEDAMKAAKEEEKLREGRQKTVMNMIDMLDKAADAASNGSAAELAAARKSQQAAFAKSEARKQEVEEAKKAAAAKEEIDKKALAAAKARKKKERAMAWKELNRTFKRLKAQKRAEEKQQREIEKDAIKQAKLAEKRAKQRRDMEQKEAEERRAISIRLGEDISTALGNAFVSAAQEGASLKDIVDKFYQDIAGAIAQFTAEFIASSIARQAATTAETAIGMASAQTSVTASTMKSAAATQSATTSIGAAAAEGAATAGAATAKTAGPLAPILVPAIAGAVFALLMAFKNAFNQGGLVPRSAGFGGRDSVPSMLTPGEFVLPTAVVDSIRSGRRPPTSTPVRPMMAGGGGGGVNVTVNALAVPRRAEFRRTLRANVQPELKRLHRKGLS